MAGAVWALAEDNRFDEYFGRGVGKSNLGVSKWPIRVSESCRTLTEDIRFDGYFGGGVNKKHSERSKIAHKEYLYPAVGL